MPYHRDLCPRSAACVAAFFLIAAASTHAQVIRPLPPITQVSGLQEPIGPGAPQDYFAPAPRNVLPPNASGPAGMPVPGYYDPAPQPGQSVRAGPPSPPPVLNAPPPTLAPAPPQRPPSQGEMGVAFGPSSELPWSWHILPTGLMYRSYLAGVKEPRLGTAWLHDNAFGPVHDQRIDTPFVGTTWDSTLGARVGILRYGTPNAYRPEGFQVDLTGSAQPRLNPFGLSTPLLSCDYTIGIPVTYARGDWQFKTGYNHLSSHMGDELLINNPSFAAQRINYVRDSIMLGVGYFWNPNLRLFGEFDYAIGLGGGSQPVELQWGMDYSPARPGGAWFWALYGDQRQELDFGGFFVVQAGWQWRGGLALSTFRIGLQYINGKSAQWEFYNTFEQRIGWGIWYDF